MTPEELARIHAESFTTPRPWSAEEIGSLADSRGAFLLTEPGGGFVLGRVIAGEAELLTIAVSPQARRRGLGGLLLSRFEAEALARSAVTAFLEVAEDNAPALALYHRAGFAEAGLRRGYYRRPDGTPVDAVVLTKPLAQG